MHVSNAAIDIGRSYVGVRVVCRNTESVAGPWKGSFILSSKLTGKFVALAWILSDGRSWCHYTSDVDRLKSLCVSAVKTASRRQLSNRTARD
jgi:hypothetical protein